MRSKPATPLTHTICPRCQSRDAILASEGYFLKSYFCPTCEHGWDVRDTYGGRLRRAGIVMPWTCPACGLELAHQRNRPPSNQLFHCHVCRIELVLDERSDTLVAVPYPLSDPSLRADRRRDEDRCVVPSGRRVTDRRR
jgi:transposase-like protein